MQGALVQLDNRPGWALVGQDQTRGQWGWHHGGTGLTDSTIAVRKSLLTTTSLKNSRKYLDHRPCFFYRRLTNNNSQTFVLNRRGQGQKINQQWIRSKAGMTWIHSTHNCLGEESGWEQYLDFPKGNDMWPTWLHSMIKWLDLWTKGEQQMSCLPPTLFHSILISILG